MSDPEAQLHAEAIRSWRRFFGGVLVVLLLVFGLVLRADDATSSKSTASPQSASLSTAQTTPTAGKPQVAAAAAADLVKYTQDPVDYISQQLYASYRQSNTGQVTDAQIASQITPPGLQVKPDTASWTQSSATEGQFLASATWTGQQTPVEFAVTLHYEAGHWKLLSLSRVQAQQ